MRPSSFSTHRYRSSIIIHFHESARRTSHGVVSSMESDTCNLAEVGWSQPVFVLLRCFFHSVLWSICSFQMKQIHKMWWNLATIIATGQRTELNRKSMRGPVRYSAVRIIREYFLTKIRSRSSTERWFLPGLMRRMSKPLECHFFSVTLVNVVSRALWILQTATAAIRQGMIAVAKGVWCKTMLYMFLWSWLRHNYQYYRSQCAMHPRIRVCEVHVCHSILRLRKHGSWTR